jgi:RNA processing factor Prp31
MSTTTEAATVNSNNNNNNNSNRDSDSDTKSSPSKAVINSVEAKIKEQLLEQLNSDTKTSIQHIREWYPMPIGLRSRVILLSLQNRYGWHFPELSTIVKDDITYVTCVRHIGDRNTFISSATSVAPLPGASPGVHLSPSIITPAVEEKIKSMAEVSMGSDLAAEDITNIHQLCDSVLELVAYTKQLREYTDQRMVTLAPHLSATVGTLKGVAAGSLQA